MTYFVLMPPLKGLVGFRVLLKAIGLNENFETSFGPFLVLEMISADVDSMRMEAWYTERNRALTMVEL